MKAIFEKEITEGKPCKLLTSSKERSIQLPTTVTPQNVILTQNVITSTQNVIKYSTQM